MSQQQRTIQKRRRKPNSRAYILAGILLVAIVACGFYMFKACSKDKEYYPLSKKQVTNILQMDENQTTGMPKEVIDYGISLLGEVNYFWGGKSLALGKDPDWGTKRLVESEGSQNTGKEIPYGLDCSGYVAWCFRQTGMSEADVRNKLGLGTYHQWENSTAIKKSDLRPGDFAFQNKPSAGENHIGICIGIDEEGKPVFIHCASKFDNVVVTHQGEVFNYFRRPNLY